jgi:hypothetical protein
MINEIKVDHTKPVWAEVWDGRYRCSMRTRIYLFSFMDLHYCVHSGFEDRFLQGDNYQVTEWQHIEFPKAKKNIPLDAKTCPRRPVLTNDGWEEGVEFYPEIHEDGLVSNGITYSWDRLFNDRYRINGLPASREVVE